MSVTIFGIRHHGPGSARALLRAIDALRPDAILVEGPPDAADALALLGHAEMRPPVALLIYAPETPRLAVYYPFAAFSPEWQALRYGLRNNVPLRFMDLPQTHQFALAATRQPIADAPASPDADEPPQAAVRADPLGWLAQAAGYSDGERWWEQMVEHRRDDADLFAAILEAMAALRAEAPPDPDPVEPLREAWMRRAIREAKREGFERIAVVCGAWHAPALVDLGGAKADAAALKGLPKIAVRATWTPWTHGRLSFRSGYGAGVESPGWYEHLWRSGEAGHSATEIAVRWMTGVARLLREHDLDASAAHAIEAVRLAEALAALRDRPLPGLPELNDAARATFCFGGDLPMRLIHERLIVGETLGAVPPETPQAPLQQDLAREQRRLRLPAEAAWRDYDLDLRKPNDLDRSRLLHRLQLLDVPWGEPQPSSGKGTFRELWRLQRQPELAVALIEAGVWGNTLADAATARARASADAAPDLPALTRLVDRALLADLPDAIDHLMLRLSNEAALASDIGHLMDALPPLANVLRYGNVRRTDAGAVAGVVAGIVTRVGIGLPGACAALNDEAAAAMFARVVAFHSAVALLQDTAHLRTWQAALARLLDMPGIHGLLAGRACRLLLDAGALPADEAARRLGLALAPANPPEQCAAWLEGVLSGSGTLLLHDEALWRIIDRWLMSLAPDAFIQSLPLLRRTFSTFAPAERRQLGERARGQAARRTGDTWQYDETRGAAVLETVASLLGLGEARM